jgi:hypothetical protein
MRSFRGEVSEIWLENAMTAGRIDCPAGVRPAPGQYLLAFAPSGETAPLAAVLFPSRSYDDGLAVAPPLPESWLPGTSLHLRGPLGHGFSLPSGARRIALAALGATAGRLLSLALQALGRGASVTLVCPQDLLEGLQTRQALPLSIEASPLEALPETLAWADFIAMDLAVEDLARLRPRLGLGFEERLPCPGQALVGAPMPCGGLADCGACAIPAQRGWKLACKHGPVFDLAELAW